MGQPCGIVFGKDGIWAVADQFSGHKHVHMMVKTDWL